MRSGQEAKGVFLPLHQDATYWRLNSHLQLKINKLWLLNLSGALIRTPHSMSSTEVTIVVSAQNSSQSRDQQTAENLAYIRQILAELRIVAEREGADMLCYLIEMAYIEAGDIQSGRRKLSVGHDQRNPPRGMPI